MKRFQSINDIYKTNKKIRTIVVDDSISFRQMVIQILASNNDFQNVGQAPNGNDILTLDSLHESDIIFMNIDSPIVNGIDVVKNALKINPNLKFIAVSMHAENAIKSQLLGAGFKGYIYKADFYNSYQRAASEVANNRSFFSNPYTMRDF